MKVFEQIKIDANNGKAVATRHRESGERYIQLGFEYGDGEITEYAKEAIESADAAYSAYTSAQDLAGRGESGQSEMMKGRAHLHFCEKALEQARKLVEGYETP